MKNPPTRSRATSAVIAKLRKSFGMHLGMGSAGAAQLLSGATMADRAYELRCVIELLEQMRMAAPSVRFVLSRGAQVRLRAKGGPINRLVWPCIIVSDRNRAVAEIWTNIEFQSLSAEWAKRTPKVPTFGDTHELDIIVTEPGISDGYPSTELLLVGVEAKHRPYNKGLLKELLGVRREMTLKGGMKSRNSLFWWHAMAVRCDPPSVLMAFCGYPSINDFVGPAAPFGMKMEHLPL